MFTKKIWQSKTFWVNIVALLVTISGLFTPELLATFGVNNPEKFLSVMGTIIAVANIILRFGNPAPIDNSVPSGTYVLDTKKGIEQAKK